MSRTDARLRHHLGPLTRDGLRDELRRERALRLEAERNATQMHALLIRERVLHLQTKKELAK